jgi:hypothetical protein
MKWAFIAFNTLMLLWLFSYWVQVAPLLQAGSEAHQTGATMGVTMGTGFIITIWGLGDIILGIPVLLTRESRIEVEGTVA